MLGRSEDVWERRAQQDKFLLRIANRTLPVVIEGEDGVGREYLARRLHDLRRERQGRFCAIDCADLLPEMVEVVFSGHEPGAFPGAQRRIPGMLELAHGGTVFLRNVDALVPEAQMRLQTFVSATSVRRLGGRVERRVDVCFCASTRTPLHLLAEKHGFAPSLAHRLSAASIYVAPLRERPLEIETIATALAREAADEWNLPTPRFTDEALVQLRGHAWPRNVSELKRVIRRATALCERDTITRANVTIAAEGSKPAQAMGNRFQ